MKKRRKRYYNIEKAKESKKYTFEITTRYYNKDSLEIIKLENFSQGSFRSEIVAPIIVGVVLCLFAKCINEDNNQNKVEINIYDQTINNIIINSYNQHNSFEMNLNNTIEELHQQNILEQNSIIFYEDGKKILFNKIQKIKNELTNNQW